MNDLILAMVESGKCSVKEMFHLLRISNNRSSVSVAIFRQPGLSLLEKVMAVTGEPDMGQEQRKCLASISWNEIEVKEGKKILRKSEYNGHLASLLFETGKYELKYMIKVYKMNEEKYRLREIVKKRANWENCSIEKLFEYYNLFEHDKSIFKVIIRKLGWEDLEFPVNSGLARTMIYSDVYLYLELGEYTYELLELVINSPGFSGEDLIHLANSSEKYSDVFDLAVKAKYSIKDLFSLFINKPQYSMVKCLVESSELSYQEKLIICVLKDFNCDAVTMAANSISWDKIDDREAYILCYMYQFNACFIKIAFENGKLYPRAMELWRKSGYDYWLIWIMVKYEIVDKKKYLEIIKFLREKKVLSVKRIDLVMEMINKFDLSKIQKKELLELTNFDPSVAEVYIKTTALSVGERIDILEKLNEV